MKDWNSATLTFSWRRFLSYRNQSTDLLYKSIDWFLYDRDICHERVKSEIRNSVTLFSATLNSATCGSATSNRRTLIKCDVNSAILNIVQHLVSSTVNSAASNSATLSSATWK